MTMEMKFQFFISNLAVKSNLIDQFMVAMITNSEL